MLAHIDRYLEFIDQVSKLNSFPEITQTESMDVKLGIFDIEKRNPVHSGKYDERLFGEFTNIFRKLIILSNENECSLRNIHRGINERHGSNQELESIKNCIDTYLTKNMNEVTSFEFSFPDSILETTSVETLLNNYFTAMHQHSKPEPQAFIDEVNSLTHGALTEMVRMMMIDIIKMLNDYVVQLRILLK